MYTINASDSCRSRVNFLNCSARVSGFNIIVDTNRPFPYENSPAYKIIDDVLCAKPKPKPKPKPNTYSYSTRDKSKSREWYID
jgi:hypothetical protein